MTIKAKVTMKLERDYADAAFQDWTPQQLSSFYSRHRATLHGQAKRLLNDGSLAEEVVQEAFLYLMTSLPELESELAVIRFLKWKVKVLSIDVLRSGRVEALSLEEIGQITDARPEPSEFLLRADDAAIIALAMSRLDPRHQRVLIETTLKEAKFDALAEEMGLTQNAFRQLLLRARRKFKEALTEEAYAAGLSVSEILSNGIRSALAKFSGQLSSVLLIGTLLASAASLITKFGLGDESSVAIRESIMAVDSFGGPQRDPKVMNETPVKLEDSNPSEALSLDTAVGKSFETAQVSAPLSSKYNFSLTLDEALEIPIRDPIIQDYLPDGPSKTPELVVDAYFWASDLLSELASASEYTATSVFLGTDAQSIEVQIGHSTTLKFMVSNAENPGLMGIWLEESNHAQSLIAVPTLVYHELRENFGGPQRLQIVISGFAVGNLFAASGTSILEDAHFSEVAIQIEMDLTWEDGQTIQSPVDLRFLPRT